MHPACRILANTSNQSLVYVLPQLAALLYSEKLIQEMIFIDVSGEALLNEIKEAVCKDYKKLEAFAVLLCKVTITVDIGNAIMREYSKYLYYNIDQ